MLRQATNPNVTTSQFSGRGPEPAATHAACHTIPPLSFPMFSIALRHPRRSQSPAVIPDIFIGNPGLFPCRVTRMKGTEEKDTGFPLTTGGNDRGGRRHDGGVRAGLWPVVSGGHSRMWGATSTLSPIIQSVSVIPTHGGSHPGHWPFPPLTPAFSRKGRGSKTGPAPDRLGPFPCCLCPSRPPLAMDSR